MTSLNLYYIIDKSPHGKSSGKTPPALSRGARTARAGGGPSGGPPRAAQRPGPGRPDLPPAGLAAGGTRRSSRCFRGSLPHRSPPGCAPHGSPGPEPPTAAPGCGSLNGSPGPSPSRQPRAEPPHGTAAGTRPVPTATGACRSRRRASREPPAAQTPPGLPSPSTAGSAPSLPPLVAANVFRGRAAGGPERARPRAGEALPPRSASGGARSRPEAEPLQLVADVVLANVARRGPARSASRAPGGLSLAWCWLPAGSGYPCGSRPAESSGGVARCRDAKGQPLRRAGQSDGHCTACSASRTYRLFLTQRPRNSQQVKPECLLFENEPVQKYVKDAITRDRAAQSLRPPVGSTQRILQELQPPVGSTQRILQELQPPVGSTQRILQELRSSRQEKRKENRYRVIASHRPACAETAVPATGAGADTDGHGAGSGAQEDASQEESGAADKSSDCCGKFQLFDIVQEEEMVGDCSVTSANPQKIDPDVILCNAVEMIRERLNVSEDAKKHCEKEDEYVYDIYYKETSAPGWIENILSVQPYREEYEWVNDDPVPEEVYEDEDDENDENNWRNDYPEEDEFLPEEDGEKEPEESSSDEEQYYRRRTWDKYRQEVLQEFGYDEMEDLGSD
ncbi:probable RNA polymerase II nuclear localization protein SLC7A6OS [Manacus vitellinus]|uniref:probable RNA polymerase II nuclear localization protein SLC7A6OS n=1 Tax=Manacus vitellinus TaxID=328815 RepID=UPI00115C6A84|nr:probable RNA polymerase II nuclear localization protein SLC7A6OS [Manacus vitellinus]